MSRKKKKKSRKRRHIIKNTTPQKNKTLRNIENKSISYSPSINKRIMRKMTIKKKKFTLCQKNYINISNSKKKQCVFFKDPQVQTIMLQNLLSKDPIDCKKITAPKQILANCWFNVFFMCFFISDKGRKFFRYLREIMITGKNERGDKVIDDWARSAFFHFNLFIEAALQGNNLAKLMDTNQIILGLNSILKNEFPKLDEAFNPIEFYESLIHYLKYNPNHILFIDAKTINHFPHKKNTLFKKYINQNNHIPDIIIVSIDDVDSRKIKSKPIQFLIPFQSKNIKYILDSCIIRDTSQTHFAACITCNHKKYGFDGESFSRISPFKWNINKNKEWNFRSPYLTVFNFRKGLQYLFYYRI